MNFLKNLFLDPWDDLERQQNSPREAQKTSPRVCTLVNV